MPLLKFLGPSAGVKWYGSFEVNGANPIYISSGSGHLYLVLSSIVIITILFLFCYGLHKSLNTKRNHAATLFRLMKVESYHLILYRLNYLSVSLQV